MTIWPFRSGRFSEGQLNAWCCCCRRIFAKYDLCLVYPISRGKYLAAGACGLQGFSSLNLMPCPLRYVLVAASCVAALCLAAFRWWKPAEAARLDKKVRLLHPCCILRVCGKANGYHTGVQGAGPRPAVQVVLEMLSGRDLWLRWRQFRAYSQDGAEGRKADIDRE